MAKKAKAAKKAEASFTYNAAASQRVLAACGGIASLASTAVEQATDSATPFLSFAQRSRIRALAVNFDGGPTQVQQAPLQRPTASVVSGGEGGLSREEVDAIVAHRVEIAVTEALQRIGVAPDSTIQTQVDGRIGAQITEQENRILDYVRGQLTDSLRVFEDRLEERLGNIETKQQSAEVDEQLEQAREDLLKNIDEVRTVDVGVDQFAFAAGIVEVDGTGTNATVDEGEIELGGFDEEIEVGDGEPVEGESAETEIEVEVAGEEYIEAEAEEYIEAPVEELSADAVEPAEELASVDVEDYVEIEAGALELADDADAADEVIIEDEPADEVVIEAQAAEQEEEEFDLGLDFGDIEVEGEVEVAVEELEDQSVELQPMDEGEELEEISLIQPVPDSAIGDAAESLDLDQSAITELEENDVGVMTLGEGPDEIIVPEEEEDDEESEIEVEIDVEEEMDDESADDLDGRTAIITKYMDRALQMGARQQFTPALELYSKVLDLDTGHFDALVSRGVIYSKTKDYRKATEDFRKAQEIAPERAGSYYGLAELHYNRRQFNKAIKNYNLALERDDQLAEAYCRRGLSYYYLKNYKVAFHDLYKAYDINPDLPKIRSFLKLVQNKIKESEG